jgi:hypothetical protein
MNEAAPEALIHPLRLFSSLLSFCMEQETLSQKRAFDDKEKPAGTA